MFQNNPFSAGFVTMEGIDASGKSKQYQMLKEHLESALHGLALYTKEPNVDHQSGRDIYDILQGRHATLKFEDLHPFEMQAHYFRNRIWHYAERIIPALADGRPVLSDRGVASMCFGVSGPDEFRPLLEIERLAFEGASLPFIWPDLIVIYDLPADVARKRMEAANRDLDGFEKNVSFQMRVRENYLAFAERYPNCVVIDASGTPEEIFRETKRVILPVLGIKPS